MEIIGEREGQHFMLQFLWFSSASCRSRKQTNIPPPTPQFGMELNVTFWCIIILRVDFTVLAYMKGANPLKKTARGELGWGG